MRLVLGPAIRVPLCLAALLLLGCASRFDEPVHAVQPAQPKGLVAVPENLELGVLEPGINPVAHARVRLLNARGQSASIAAWETSCPCVRIRPARLHLAAGGTALLEVVVDLRGEEPRPGRVGVQVVGRGREEAELVNFLVMFEVGAADAAGESGARGARWPVKVSRRARWGLGRWAHEHMPWVGSYSWQASERWPVARRPLEKWTIVWDGSRLG